MARTWLCGLEIMADWQTGSFISQGDMFHSKLTFITQEDGGMTIRWVAKKCLIKPFLLLLFFSFLIVYSTLATLTSSKSNGCPLK